MPRFIGDAIMIHQVLEPLRLEGQPLVAWGPAGVVELFQGSKAFEGACADPLSKPSPWDMAKILRNQGASGVLNLSRSQRASLAAMLAWVPLRAGWSEGLGWLFCNHSLAFKSLNGHQLERYAQLVQKIFHTSTALDLFPFKPRQASLDEAMRLLGDFPRPFVIFSLGAMSWSKRLGLEVWIELGLRLQRQGFGVVLIGAAGEDQRHAEEISKKVGESLDLPGQTTLSVAAGVMLHAAGLVGNDSGLSHLGAICRVPMVTVFGPTNPELTAPRSLRARVVRNEDLPCLVCMRGDCSVPGHPCLHAIEADVILKALEEAGLRTS
jgi:ADP-heptose:LPS heptosyltransferase